MTKASADDTKRAESPTAAAVMWTMVPRWMPSTETSPAARPCSTERATMKSTAGPGVSSRTIEAATNNPHRVGSGMGSLSAVLPAEQAISRAPRQAALPLPSRERKGPIAEQWEGEGAAAALHIVLRQPPHPSHAPHGPLPSPARGEGKLPQPSPVERDEALPVALGRRLV